jgi:hypothetical protein
MLRIMVVGGGQNNNKEKHNKIVFTKQRKGGIAI